MAAEARNFTVTGSEFVAENFYERLVQGADSGEHTHRTEAVNIVPPVGARLALRYQQHRASPVTQAV